MRCPPRSWAYLLPSTTERKVYPSENGDFLDIKEDGISALAEVRGLTAYRGKPEKGTMHPKIPRYVFDAAENNQLRPSNEL